MPPPSRPAEPAHGGAQRLGGAAARLHHRTSSAISQQIRKLERHLGVALLERAAAASGSPRRRGRAARHPEARDRDGGALRPPGRAVGAPARDLRVAVSDYLGRPCWCRCCASSWKSGCRCASRSPPPTREGIRLVGLGEVDCAVVTGQEIRAGSRPSISSTSPSSGSDPGAREAVPLPDQLAASRCCGSEPAARAGGSWRTT